MRDDTLRADSLVAFSTSWWQVLIAFVCLVFAFGVQTAALPLVYAPVIEEFGWSRAQVTLIATVKFGAGAAAAIPVGILVDRLGIRRVAWGLAFLNGVAMIAFLGVRSLWHFYAVGAVAGVGAVGIMICAKVLVSRWFTKRQGVAMGVALLGTSVAGSVTPFLVNALMNRFGWRETLALLSLGVWFIVLPLVARKAREGPRSEGASWGGSSGATNWRSARGEIAVLLRSRSLWLIGLAVACIGFVDQALIQHTALYVDEDLKLGRLAAASAVSLVFAASVPGKVGFGWVYDRLSIRGVQLCYVALAGSVMIAWIARDPTTLIVFALLRGLAHGGTIVDDPVLVKHTFGLRGLGCAISVVTTFGTAGFAVGPPILGYLHDVQGSYRSGFLLLIVLSTAAAVLIAQVSPLYWQSRPADVLAGGPVADVNASTRAGNKAFP